MRSARLTRLGAAVLGTTVFGVAVTGQAPVPSPTNAAGFDLVAADNGGRVEWTTSHYPPTGARMNLIATTPNPGWFAADGVQPQEIVFSFFSRQSALVASVHINPMTFSNHDRPKDIEVWTSTQSSTEGFTRVAAGTLEREDRLQPLAFTPVEAKFVKLRVVTTRGAREIDKPGSFPIGASRVKVIEGARPGYVSIVERNPDLAALANGALPLTPAAEAKPTAAADTPIACSVQAETPRKSNFPQSREVLVVSDSPMGYRALGWKSSVVDTQGLRDRKVVEGVNFTWTVPFVAAPANLITEPRVDTIILAQVCHIKTQVSASFKQALMVWVAAGHKLIIQDSDFCSAAPVYDFLPYRFAAINPGAFGAKGEAGVLENSMLASRDPASRFFIDTDKWRSGPNDLGDSGIIVEHDAHWCGALWAKNRLKKNGFAVAYARHGRGLIIYDGFDQDQVGSEVYVKLLTQELKLPFDGDPLACTQPLGAFVITADSQLKSQHFVAGKTYTYPLSVLAGFGYSGKVTLDASVLPIDPGIAVALQNGVADLTTVDEASATLTVSAAPTASFKSKVIAVRGKDAAGKTNILCLNLPERTGGGLTILSGFRRDKPPTKNLEIILDASGSMKALLGKQTRWATAQAVLKDVVSKLPKDFSVGLRAYGHTLPSTNPKTCTDTALVVPVAPLNPTNLLAAAGKLLPRGETPLVHSILQTPGDLKTVGGGTVILITDGEESCKGDFAAAARTLKDAGLNLTLNIVGFTLKNVPAQTSLSGLAESTGGRYYSAQSGAALGRALLLAAVDRLPYRILDAAGNEVAQGEAGNTPAHELPPGTYSLVVTAGEETLKVPLSVALRQDQSVTVVVKDDKLAVADR